ncbi:hypothetical protein [Hymenobacter terrenus]|uniref:hypothetical protein n=1 Tax=Hymenobacter terrenus TaxID=1629124 RepID=UPI000619EC05|nr:hypothetical protein [Hymenobacter terrenus]
MKSATFFFLLLTGLSGSLRAQSTTDSLRRRGELTGARPSGDLLAKPRARAATQRTTASEPVQQHLLQTDINLAQASASQLPDLYDRFMTTTRDERRKWSYQDWDNAGQVLARLNERYEQVRTELPLEERLRIRSFQGEFHTLRGARKVKDKISD